jgi:hypothetical protein
LDSVSRGSDADLVTGSIRPTAVRAQALPQPAPGDPDLATTRAAVVDALARGGGRNTSVPWEDPATGARGTVTPLSNASRQDGAVCRDFLASYVRDGTESWLQGEACRGRHGRWEVRQMRPWRRT